MDHNIIYGKVVYVTNKNSKYYGDKAVIRYATRDKYKVVSLNKTPTKDRFIYLKGKVNGTCPAHKGYYINKKDVKLMKYMKKVDLNMDETLRLLNKNLGSTKKDIEIKYNT